MKFTTTGLPADIAARLRAVDEKRKASGLVVIATKGGADVFRYSLRNEADKQDTISKIERSGHTWRLAGPND